MGAGTGDLILLGGTLSSAFPLRPFLGLFWLMNAFNGLLNVRGGRVQALYDSLDEWRNQVEFAGRLFAPFPVGQIHELEPFNFP